MRSKKPTSCNASADAAERHQAPLDEQARRAHEYDRSVGEKPRTIAVLGVIGVSAVTHFVTWLIVHDISHELYMALSGLLGIIGAGPHQHAQEQLLYRVQPPHLSLCLTAPGPVFVNHYIAAPLAFQPTGRSSSIQRHPDVDHRRAITIDSRLTVLVGLNLVGLFIAVRDPQWIAQIMAILPTLCILFMFVLFRQQAREQRARRGTRPAYSRCSNGCQVPACLPARMSWISLNWTRMSPCSGR